MIKKIIAFLVFAIFAVVTANAQMTDEQVVDYVKQHSAMGESQKDIAVSLLKQGVTQEQMLRLKQKYEEASVRPVGKSQEMGTEDDARMRSNNGEQVPDNPQTEEKNGPMIFGHDIFRSKNLSFAPNMNIATPAEYTLGPGDEVLLDVYGASQVSTKYKVSPDGTIVIENVGPVSVSGMTASQAQSVVRSRIGGYYQGSSIKLTIGQTRTIMVNVVGEVEAPGTYTLSAFSTVFNALYLAGGVTDIGTIRNIQVSRDGKIISVVDVYEYIVNGKLAGNIMLQDNDVIMVGPYVNLIEVVGKVKRPMIYEAKKEDNLQAILTVAGGFTGDAYKQKVRVERKSDEGLTVHNVDATEFSKFRPTDGDIVVALPIVERYKNTVKVSGAVFRPGTYKLSENVSNIKQLVEIAGGLDEQALTTRAVLHRMKKDRTLQAQTVDLEGIMSGTTADILLKNEDELIIASAEKLNEAKILSIEGEVQMPGQYQYSEGETIEDLITEAGGLTEYASIENVEVARRITSSKDNPDGNQMAKVYTFNLSDGLSIKGETGFKLMPFDYVTIHRNPDYQEQKRVTISGEVKYAGSYILSSKEERLSDVLRRAGGFTTKAFSKGTQLTRKFTQKEIELKMRKLDIANNAEDSLDIMASLSKMTYAVGIDMDKALKAPGSLDDVVLMEGDSIYVPRLNNVVKISGNVLYPNTVAFANGKNYKYYLNQAGGVSKSGDKGQTYIVYANGQVSKASKGKITPGCEIVVPQKEKKEINPQTASMYIGGASALASIAAVVSSILR